MQPATSSSSPWSICSTQAGGSQTATGTDVAGGPRPWVRSENDARRVPEARWRNSGGPGGDAAHDGRLMVDGDSLVGHGILPLDVGRRPTDRGRRGKQRCVVVPRGCDGPVSRSAACAGRDVGELRVVGRDASEQRTGAGVVAGSLLEVGERVPEAQVVVVRGASPGPPSRSRSAIASVSWPWSASAPAATIRPSVTSSAEGEAAASSSQSCRHLRPAMLGPVAVHENGVLLDRPGELDERLQLLCRPAVVAEPVLRQAEQLADTGRRRDGVPDLPQGPQPDPVAVVVEVVGGPHGQPRDQAGAAPPPSARISRSTSSGGRRRSCRRVVRRAEDDVEVRPPCGAARCGRTPGSAPTIVEAARLVGRRSRGGVRGGPQGPKPPSARFGGGRRDRRSFFRGGAIAAGYR